MSRLDEYLSEVSKQIRVKRIRSVLTDELRDHMELQKADFMNEGMLEAEAERRTIEEMGNALLVGGELDRVHRPKPQWKGILFALALMLIGVLLRTVFTPMGQAQPVDMKQCAGVCVGMGMILLLGLVDYAHWIRMAVPLTAAWGSLFFLKIVASPNWISRYLYGLLGNIEFVFMMRITPEHVSMAAPVLLGLLIAGKRGGGRAAFAACLSIPVMTFLLGLSYTWSYYTPHAVMLMALLCTALLMIAVRKGFFKIRRSSAYAALGGLTAAILVVLIFFSAHTDLSRQAYYWEEFVYPLLRQAKMLGSGRVDIELLVKMNELYSDDLLLPFLIYRFGWISFAVLTAAVVGMLIWMGRKFVRMENRSGSMLGMSCGLTLALQVVLYYVHCYTVLNWPLGFPLISYGTVMLWIDAAMFGLMLSVLCGENLPETEFMGRRKRSGGIAA